MRSLRNLVKVLASTTVPVLLLIGVVGWAEQRAHPLVGGANAPALATPALDPYPLPGPPSGPISPKPSPTLARLQPYPPPGSPATATPTASTSKSSPPPLSIATTTLTPYVWLPLILRQCYFKNTAPVSNDAVPGQLRYSHTLEMGVCGGYEWNHVYTPTHPAYSRPWQVINSVRSTVITSVAEPVIPVTWHIGLNGGCDGLQEWIDTSPFGQARLRECVHNVAERKPGLYWLIWNEPDDLGQDNFSPAQGAQFFREISNTILGADPTARLIVGNVLNRYYGNPTQGCPNDPNAPIHYGCGEYWLTQFISEAMALGYDPKPYIAGYGFHVYSEFTYVVPSQCILEGIFSICHDPWLLSTFTNTVMTFSNWVTDHDVGKEVWLTEINWHPNYPGEDWDTQLRRMSDICSTLTALPIDRYFWFFGGYSQYHITESLFITETVSSPLSPAGERFASPPSPSSGGCPVFR